MQTKKLLNLSKTVLDMTNYLKDNIFILNSSEITNFTSDFITAVHCIHNNLETIIKIPNGYLITLINDCKNLDYTLNTILNSADKKIIYNYLDREASPLSKDINHLLNIVNEIKLTTNTYAVKDLQLKKAAKFKNYFLTDFNHHTYPYDVSIMIPCYNGLEYNKIVFSSLLKNTNFEKYKIEIIIVNNGSTDGTKEYFEQFPDVKLINLKYNTPCTLVGNHYAQGKYFAAISNDIYITPNWLDNLIACIESDPLITAVIPTCNEDSISNNQGITVPYENSLQNVTAIEAFSANYNQSNPQKWEESSRSMTYAGLYKKDILLLMDNIYEHGYFIDDDISAVLRQSGLKQILANDTFLHHFGSITLGPTNKSIDKMMLMRRIYYEKWHIDSWDKNDLLSIDTDIFANCSFTDNLNILYITPKMAVKFLKLKYTLSQLNKKIIHSTAIVFDKYNLGDVNNFFDSTIHATSLNAMLTLLENKKYDMIVLEDAFSDKSLASSLNIINKFYNYLAPNGLFIFTVSNSFFCNDLKQLLEKNPDLPIENKIHTLPINPIPAFKNELMKKKPKTLQTVFITFPPDNLEDLATLTSQIAAIMHTDATSCKENLQTLGTLFLLQKNSL